MIIRNSLRILILLSLFLIGVLVLKMHSEDQYGAEPFDTECRKPSSKAQQLVKIGPDNQVNEAAQPSIIKNERRRDLAILLIPVMARAMGKAKYQSHPDQ